MLKPRYRSNQLICGFDKTPFMNVAAVLASLFLIIDMLAIAIRPFGGSTVDLPQVSHPISMQRADREDALMVAVMRDGKVFFGSSPVRSSNLPARIQESVSRGAERKVYIKADARAKYRTVKEALDGIHAAGIEKIGILVEQRKPPSPAP